MSIMNNIQVDNDIFYLSNIEIEELFLPYNHHLNRQIYYYYYYSKYIYQFFQNELISYKWLNLQENEEYLQQLLLYYSADNYQNVAERHKKNKFLATSETISLSSSIKNIGLFFPFFILQNNNISDCLYFGKHRLYSIMQNKQQFKKQKFLFIFMNLNQPQLKTSMDCYYFSKKFNYLYKTTTNSIELIWKSFKFFSESLPNLLFEEKINPNPIFNNEKALQYFLEKSFLTIPELENFVHVNLL